MRQPTSKTIRIKEQTRGCVNRWRNVRDLTASPGGVQRLQEWLSNPTTQAVIAGARFARTPRANTSLSQEQAAAMCFIDSGWHGCLDYMEGLGSRNQLSAREAFVRQLVEVEMMSMADAVEVATLAEKEGEI